MIKLSGEVLPIVTQASFRFGQLQNEELALIIQLSSSEGETLFEAAIPVNRAIVLALGLNSYLYEAAHWRFDGFRPAPEDREPVESDGNVSP